MEINIEPNSQHVTWMIKDFLELPQKDDSYSESPQFMFSGDRYCLRVYPNVNRSNGRRTEFHLRRLGVSVPEREVSCKVGMRFRLGESTRDDWYLYRPVELETNVRDQRSTIEEKRDMFVPDGSFLIVCSMCLSKDSRAGSSAQEEEEQGGFPAHNVLLSSRWSSPKMEMLIEYPCAQVQLTLPKFFDLPRETCDSLTSSEFRFAGDTYCLRFRANGETTDTDLELVRLTFSIPERTVSYRVGYCGRECREYLKNSRSLVGGTGLCITRSKLEQERNWYVTGGTLRVLLFLRLEEQSSAVARTSVAVQTRTGLSGFRKLQADYSQLLRKGTESDACVVVCGQEFQVHKNVLRARSPVFDAMFGHDTAEKESGRVVIDDLDPDSFDDFLEYLYTGDVQDQLSDEKAFGLYAFADKYDVSTLKSECVEHMRKTLSVNSFCDVVALALRHGEEDLHQQAIKFFKDNLQQIIITAKWQQFNIENGATANELLIKALVPGKQ